MAKYVFRIDLRQQPVSEPLQCVDASEMFARPAAPSVEECVHMLLADDEICLGANGKRAIMRGAKLVGYVRIVDDVDLAVPNCCGTTTGEGRE